MSYFDKIFYANFGNGSSTGYYAVTSWAATATVAAGVFRRQLATPTVGDERCFVCIVAGTTGGSEPAWVKTRGALTLSDGTVTWQECTGMAGPNESTQTNAPTWTTVKNAAVSIGEVIYDSGSASLQIASVPGTAGNGSTPSFSATAGVPTIDNGVTWTSLGLASGFTGWQTPHARLANALASGWSAAIAGSKVYVSNNSAATQASSVVITTQALPPLPVAVLCVNDAAAPPTALATTASITCSSGNLQIATTTQGGATGFSENAYYNGIQFIATAVNGSIFNQSNGDNNISFDNCVLNLNNNGGNGTILMGGGQNSGAIIKHNATTFLFGSTSHAIIPQGGWLLFQSCNFASSGIVPTNLFRQSANIPAVTIVMRDCDLSNINTNLILALSGAPLTAECTTHILLQNCKLNASMVPVSGTISMNPGIALRMHNCDSGNTNYKFYAQSYLGTIQQETTVVRTSGSSSNGTGLSVKMVSNANSGFTQPLITYPPFGDEISVFNPFTSGSHTCTVFLTSDTVLDNSLFWADLEYLGTAGFPQGLIVSSKMAWFGTPTTLTSDSSTWGGAIAHKYKIVLTYTPTEVGWMKVRLGLAAPSATVFVDYLPVLA